VLSARTPHERTSLENANRGDGSADDQFVYELYGLTPEEIKIVEEGTA
jgi:hypothetical protein